MPGFKGRHFFGQVILWAARWYCKYGISFCELVKCLRCVELTLTTRYSIGERWMYLYRAITDSGETVDFYLSTIHITILRA